MKALFVGLLAALLALPAVAEEIDFEDRGRAFTEEFLTGDVNPLWEAMTRKMRNALGNVDALAQFQATIQQQAGAPGAIVRETLTETQGFHVYQQVRSFENTDKPLVIQWAFESDGDVAGVFAQPQKDEPSAAFEDYDTKTRLQLPFEGEWFVFWGGREREQNYHVDHPNQRYAMDLVVMRGGATYKGDPKVAENYHCWGLDILAPASGTVVVAIDGDSDHVPGEMNPSNPPGNHVVIDHGNDEYSLLAHLQKGSVAVAEGDVVETGQVLGRCGNSGNTSEPHLHYHLQNAPAFGQGHGLPAPFYNYLADDDPVDVGEPFRGQFIRSPE